MGFSAEQNNQRTQLTQKDDTNNTNEGTDLYNKHTQIHYTNSKRNTNNNRHNNKNKLHKKIHKKIQEKTVINLSNKPLTNTTLRTLSKGLTFSPTPRPTTYNHIHSSFVKFRKNLYNRYHFRNKTSHIKHPFKLPTRFTHSLPDDSNLQEYISNVLSDLKDGYTKHVQSTRKNLSKHELQSINELKTDSDLIVKPADKGGAIVIWSKDAYLAEAYRQLNNNNQHKKLTYDPTDEILTQTKTLAFNLHKSRIIDNLTHKFLRSDTQARTPQLYLLPKIHKPDIPGRPTISGCGGPTVKLSQYADHLLKPQLKHIPSYVQDTTDFSRRIFTLNKNLTNDFILITIDVKSLYTNIPNDEGIQACIDMFKKHNKTTTELEQSIFEVLTHILKNNSFSFNNEHYSQIHGTAMGSPMAPTYANIFMAMLEQKLLKEAPEGLIPIEWIRFIDDIFAIWTHGLDKLQTFLSHINRSHPTIKFEYTFSTQSVNFLDTTIYINSTGKLESDLYIRPTDRTLLLHQTSFHPQSCKDAIIYSQALRYRRIITDNDLLQKRLNDLLITLVHRGYKKETIQTAFNKAPQHTQNDLLYKSENNQKNNSPIFSIPYNNNTKYIAQILRKHWNIIENDPTLRILWPEPPIVAYQRNKNLKDNLVHTKLTQK